MRHENSDGPQLTLRNAQPEDCELLWNWVNDPAVRASAIATGPIPWAEHVEWFTKKMASRTTMILIAQDGLGADVGQIRFDWAGQNSGEIDISIDAGRRGTGLAATLLLAATECFFERTGCKSVTAFVKEGNSASLRAFEIAGFRRVGFAHKKGCGVIHLAKEKP